MLTCIAPDKFYSHSPKSRKYKADRKLPQENQSVQSNFTLQISTNKRLTKAVEQPHNHNAQRPHPIHSTSHPPVLQIQLLPIQRCLTTIQSKNISRPSPPIILRNRPLLPSRPTSESRSSSDSLLLIPRFSFKTMGS